jgi:hypothetical protein
MRRAFLLVGVVSVTKRASYTEAQIRRNLKAALRVGLHIAGICPDGSACT